MSQGHGTFGERPPGKPQSLSFEDWCREVEALLRQGEIFEQALLVGGAKNLVELRGDEPRDVYNLGDPPELYAIFLHDEWALFGPQGE